MRTTKNCHNLSNECMDSGWVDREDLRSAMVKASSSLGRASETDMKNIESIPSHF